MEKPPTLEELRNLTKAAWLWDGARGRIVWANAAGVSYFSGESVFDLIDRPFDPTEPGVERIIALTQNLPRETIETVELHFPSADQAQPLRCHCQIHTLADGRSGLLVIDATKPPAPLQQVPPERLATAFQLLPLAAAFMGSDGSLHQLNNAARLLLGHQAEPSLGHIMGNDPRADVLLQRLSQAGIVSDIFRIETAIGKRDVRLTLTRLTQETDPLAHAIILMDDITERRALERQLAAHEAGPIAAPASTTPVSPAPAPQATSAPAPSSTAVLAPSDAEAFQHLGKLLNHAVAEHQSAKPASVTEIKPAPPRPVVELPSVLRNNLERAQDALLIAQAEAVIYANNRALQLLGYDKLSDLIADDQLWELFSARQHNLPATDITLSRGQKRRLSATFTTIAWLNGPARQFVLIDEAAKSCATRNKTATSAHPTTSDEATFSSVPAIRPLNPLPYPKPAEPSQTPQKVAETPALATHTSRPPALSTDAAPASPLKLTDPANAEELRTILDTATDGIITLDHDGAIHTFSAGAEAIFGYRNAEVIDKKLADLLTPESRKIFRDYLAALKGPGLASVFNDGREVTAVVKQGGTVPLFLTISVLPSASTRTAFCAVVRDITQWKRTESELRQAKDEAEATSRQKSEFLARISHELRTPLNAILGFSEVMRLERFGELKNDKYRGYVNDIHASGSLLLSLINDLLDLSKVEAGQLELNFTSVNLNDIIDTTMNMLQEAATSARVILRKSLPTDLPNVVADQRSMRQIMLNTLSNAIKFTDPGGQVIISAQMNKAGELKLRVKDTGIGMNDEQVITALQPFRRIATKGREAEGTGLGLPLIKALAEANRTSFAITSEPRKGTSIELTFPTTRVLAD